MWLSGSWHDRRGDTRWPADGEENGEGERGTKAIKKGKQGRVSTCAATPAFVYFALTRMKPRSFTP